MRIPGWFRFTVLALTIGGGLYGIGTTLWLLPRVHNALLIMLVILMTAAYGFVTVAGIIFWRNSEQIEPLNWALSLQIPWISAPGFVYQFASGLYFVIALVASNNAGKYSAGFTANFNFGSSWEFRFLQDAPISLGVNLVPLGALLFLRKLARTAERSVEGDPSTQNVEP